MIATFQAQHEEFASWLTADGSKGRRTRNGDEVRGRCPLQEHEDKDGSFGYDVAKGVWACSCGSGVGSELWVRLGWNPRNGTANAMPPVSQDIHYDYKDEKGKPLFQVVRKPGKRFLQRHKCPEGQDGWTWSITAGKLCKCPTIRRVLYRLPELLAGADPVLVVEGEKDVETARKLGFTATCNSGGACKWKDEYAYAECLKGREVYILPDNDPEDPNPEKHRKGLRHAQEVMANLTGKAKSVAVLGFAAKGKDLTDWIEAGGTKEDVEKLIEKARGELGEKEEKLEVIFAPELVELEFPERESIFSENKIPLEGLGLVTGESRAGKGAITLALGTAAALGVDVGDGFKTPKTRRVVYYTAEDTLRRVKERFCALCKGHESTMAGVDITGNLNNNIAFLVKPKPGLKFDSPKDVDLFLKTTDKIKPELIIMDNLRRFFDGDENDGAVVAPVMEGIERVRDHTGAAVLLIHHIGKSQANSKVYGGRGSTVIPGFVDYQLKIERPEGGSVAEIHCHDSKDADDWWASFEQVRGEDGSLRYKLQQSQEEVTSHALEEALNKTHTVLKDLAIGSPSGVEISYIEEKLGIVRNTATKYLETLQKRELARKIRLGFGKKNLWLPLSKVGEP